MLAPLRILVACEFSGRVRAALRRLGHDAFSCDLLAAEDGSPHHFQCDVRHVASLGWDGMIAHPDCTYHVVSGNRWFYHTPKRPRPDVLYGADRYRARDEARAFALWLWRLPIPCIAIENPIGTLGDVLGKPAQIVQPFQFGDPYRKATCLWLKNLPALVPTNDLGDGEQACWRESPGPERKKNRARTYPGFAEALADQLGTAMMAATRRVA